MIPYLTICFCNILDRLLIGASANKCKISPATYEKTISETAHQYWKGVTDTVLLTLNSFFGKNNSA